METNNEVHHKVDMICRHTVCLRKLKPSTRVFILNPRFILYPLPRFHRAQDNLQYSAYSICPKNEFKYM